MREERDGIPFFSSSEAKRPALSRRGVEVEEALAVDAEVPGSEA